MTARTRARHYGDPVETSSPAKMRREPDDDERYADFNGRRFRYGCPHCHGYGYTPASYSNAGEPCDCEEFNEYRAAVGEDSRDDEEDD